MKSSTTIIHESSANIVTKADSDNKQSKVPLSRPIGPTPPMPEPQMQPYQIIKRYGNISKCHGCDGYFDKRETTWVLFRKETDWWPKTDMLEKTKQWVQTKRNFYYCTSLSCLMMRRPSLKKENITVIYNGDDVEQANEAFSRF